MEKTIGERIADFRRERNIQQYEFADQIGVSRQTLSLWETGKQIPRADKVYEICARFGVSPTEFFGSDTQSVAVEESALQEPEAEFTAEEADVPVEKETEKELDRAQEAPMPGTKEENKGLSILKKIERIWRVVRGWIATLFFAGVLIGAWLVQISPNANDTTVRVWLVDWSSLTVILAIFVLLLCGVQIVRTILFFMELRRHDHEEE